MVMKMVLSILMVVVVGMVTLVQEVFLLFKCLYHADIVS